jgi:DNA polymerase elongation subunit (family B)
MENSTFFSYSWHIDDKEKDVTSIRVYGLNKNNENVCLRIDNFTPYVYIELPEHIPWTNSKALLVGKKIDELLKQQKPISKALTFKQRLYYAHLTKNKKRKLFPYLFCCFSNRSDIKSLSYRIRNAINIIGIGYINLKMHEQDASEILQFTSLRNISTAGWIKFSGKKIGKEEKVTLCDHEYKVKWKNVQPEISDDISKPLIMGFDIEVNSSVISSMPKAERTNDKVFQISCVLYRHDSTKYNKFLLTLGDPEQKIVGKDVTIIKFKTESDLLVGFANFIQKYNPNVITGYNIFCFDIPYMIDRAEYCYCKSEFDKQGFTKFSHAKETTISWTSSAYGTQIFKFLDAEGRLFVDLLPLIKRDYKLSNYRLKTVSTFFLGQTKDDLSVKGIFKCYRVGIQNKKGVYDKKAKKAMGIVGKYCMMDSMLVVKLFDKLQTWIGLCMTAHVCNVPIFYLYTQGQQIKVYSQIYKYCIYKNIVVEKDGYIPKDNEHFVGAVVFDPIPGLYEKVLPFDFCLSGNSRISLSNGLSKTLNSLSDEIILGYNNIGFTNYPIIGGLQVKGIKNTIKLYFEDGTTIISTPEHKLLTVNNNWQEAQKLNNKYVKCGLEYPLDLAESNTKWILNVKGFILDVDKNRDRTLAFSRIIGYIINKSHIFFCKNTHKLRIKTSFNTMIDSINFSNDLKMIDNSSKHINTKDDKKYSILISSYVSNIILSLKGLSINKYNVNLPHFISDINCPLSIVREFLAGFYGANSKTLSFISTHISLFYITNNVYIKNTSKMFLLLSNLHKRFKFPVNIKIPCIYDKKIKLIMYLNTQYMCLFYKNIGFRYNINNSLLLMVISSYKNMLNNIKKVIPKISIMNIVNRKICYNKYFKINEAKKKIKDISFKKYLQNTGTSKWFEDLPVKLNSIYIPHMNKKVINIIDNGYQTVYDIEVKTAHNFLANGIIVHNCSLYPTTIIAYNIDYSTLVLDDSIPDSDCHVMEWEDHVMCAHDPKIIRKLQLNEVIDKEKNEIKKIRKKRDDSIDKLTKLKYKKQIEKMLKDLKPYTDERSDLVKKKVKHVMCSKRYFRFLKEPKGVMPTVIENLLNARKETRTEQKQLKLKLNDKKLDKNTIKNINDLINVLEKRQLAFKISANSMYGSMGVSRGYLPFMPGAMSTTAMGRKNINIVAKTIPEKYGGKLIYGDTDSNYIVFPHIQTAKDNWDYAIKVAEEISKLFPNPIELEFENEIYWQYCILSKKRYMYKKCCADGVVDDKVGKKGVLTARRDNCAWVRQLYDTVMYMIFDKNTREEILFYIIQDLNKLCFGFYSYKDLIITKSIGSYGDFSVTPFFNEKGQKKGKMGDYTVPLLPSEPDKREKQFKLKNCSNSADYYTKCLPAQVQLSIKMKERGQIVDTGSRLEYVIIERLQSKKQYEKIEDSVYYNNHNDVLSLDYMYYMGLSSNPIDQILNVVYFNKNNEDKYKFTKNFMLDQFKIRKNRLKLLQQLKTLFTPTIIFK